MESLEPGWPTRLVGGSLRRLGILGLCAVPGMIAGFWIADAGVSWMPTMLNALLTMWLLSLAFLLMAESVVGRVRRRAHRGPRVRRRVALGLLVLVLIGVGVRLAVGWTQQPVPLTKMTTAQFDATFQIDADRYRQFDATLRGLVAALESRTGLFGDVASRVPTVDEEQFLRSTWAAVYDTSFALDGIREYYEDWYRFDPSRAGRPYLVRSYLLTFAAELTLYETASRVASLLDTNDNVVKFLNAPAPDGRYGAGTVDLYRRALQGARDAARVVAGRGCLAWLKKVHSAKLTAQSLGCLWLWEKAESQLARIDDLPLGELSATTIDSDLHLLKRGVHRVWFPMQKGVSQWMGNTRVRRAGTYLITPDQQTKIVAALAPGDILLSRKNWYLSNVGLPGFWPHAILHIGAPDELAAYFDDAAVKAYLQGVTGAETTLPQYLEATYPRQWGTYRVGIDGEPIRLIEAVGPGVVLNTMQRAAGDYMAAIRPRLSKVAKAQAIIEAFRHLGKPYDFDFDFATDHALVCTELVWRSYRPAEGKDGLTFNLVTIAGRRTLPANEIAATFAAPRDSEAAQLEFVYFIDAREDKQASHVSTEEAFCGTHLRSKWDVSQQ